MKENKPRRKIKIGRLIILSLMFIFFIVGGIGLGYVVGAIKNMPDWDPRKLQAAETTFIYDYKGQPVSKLHMLENREEVKLNRMPDHLKNAFLATEDSKFYDHFGVRIDAIARAVLANLVGGWGSEGGSTITQQLIKNAFFNKPEKTLERKIQELVLSLQLERNYTKNEILEMYLNRIYFDGGAYGVQAASQYYFDKNVEDLELHESAMLAGVVKSPARYSPFRHPEAAKERRSTVLDRMVTNNFISAAEANQAKEKPLAIERKESNTSTNKYQYFLDHVLDEGTEILEKTGKLENPQQAMFQGGLRIFTTLDPRIQEYAESVYAQDKYFPKGKSGKIIQSAIVVIDPRSGEIRAEVGGRKYEQKRGFNRAIAAKRQPGSAFKPIAVFAPALLKGFGPSTVLDDSPVTYNLGGSTWTPQNYDGKYLGPITMRTAVQRSINVYAVKLLELIGPNEGLRFAEEAGITTMISRGARNDLNLSMALGGLTNGVTPLELSTAFAIFANQGVYNKPYVITKITDKEGTVLYEHRPEQRVVMDPQNAYLMTSMLQAVLVSPGTGTGANFGRPAAGKTGTTSDYTNAWFVGYTPDLLAAVWMGYDNQNESMGRVSGGNYPAQIWKTVMAKAHEGIRVSNFDLPPGLSNITVCKQSGKIPNGLCPAEDQISEIFSQDKIPTEVCDLHVQAEICPESGKLATSYCPYRVTQVFVKRDIKGEGEEPADTLPQESCNLHGLDAIFPTLPIQSDSENTLLTPDDEKDKKNQNKHEMNGNWLN